MGLRSTTPTVWPGHEPRAAFDARRPPPYAGLVEARSTGLAFLLAIVLVAAPVMAGADPPDPGLGPLALYDGGDGDELVALVLDGVAVVLVPPPSLALSLPSLDFDLPLVLEAGRITSVSADSRAPPRP